MKYLTLLLCLSATNLFAQLETQLTAWFSFDRNGCEIADQFGNPNVQTFVNGDVFCDCGVEGNSLFFDGDDDWFFVFGPDVEKAFSTIDFSLSFYFKSTTVGNKTVTLFNKMKDCEPDGAFSIGYHTGTRNLFVTLSESNTVSGSLSYTLPYTCWYHIVVVRKGGETILYLNGEEVSRVVSPGSQRVNLKNDEPLIVGQGTCVNSEDFQGYLDEIRLYNRALKREEVKALYVRPDQIATGLSADGKKDTIIFLGNSVQIALTNTCANGFVWTPSTGVSDPSSPSPLLTPQESTTYRVQIDDGLCLAADSIHIEVIDPSDVKCTDVLLPNAFTPNSDRLNDGFGISNPFVVGELLHFEVYDRWGNVVFSTSDPLEKWDGRYKGSAVNPGVYLYKIHFRCEEKESIKTGSVTVIR